MPRIRILLTILVAAAALDASMTAASSLGRGGVRFSRHLAGLDNAVAASAPGGALVVGGNASAAGLPVTPNAVHSTFRASPCPTGGLPYTPLCTDGYVAKFAADGTLLYGTVLWGGASVLVRSVASGPDGAIYAAVLANAGVDGAPLPLSLDGASHLYILKVSADPSHSVTAFLVTEAPRITPAKLAVDRGGNLYLAGSCDIGTLAATGGAFEPQASGTGAAGCVLSFAPSATSARYATYLGSSQDSIRDLVLDDQGNAYLAGSTYRTDFPGAALGWNGVQFGAPAFASSYGFVAVLDASGASILWSSVFGSALSGGATQVLRNARGDVAVVGLAVQDPISTIVNQDLSPLQQISVVKFSGDPTQPVYAVQVAAGVANPSIGAAMDDGGAVVLTGMTSYLSPGGIDSPSFVTTADGLERCVSGTRTRFFMRLGAADGSIEYASFFGPDQQSYGSQVALGSGQSMFVLMGGTAPMDLTFYGGQTPGAGQSGTAIVAFDPSLAPPRARLCATNAANYRPDALAAGTMVAIFGSDLGPAGAVFGDPDENGNYPLDLAGAQVLLNGSPIPLIAVQQNQIDAWIPPDAPPNARLEVRSANLSQAMDVQIHQSAPGLFGRAGSAAAVAENEDGSQNGPDRPAPRGSVVQVHGTGFGPAAPFRAPETFVGNQPAALLSVTHNPGSPPGMVDLRVQVPQYLPPAFQSVANLQFRSGLFILQTNLFIWVK